MKLDIPKLLKELTLEEKAGLCSGKNFWETKDVARLGLPSVMVSDGPHGLRKQAEQSDHLGINESIKAVCFPTGSAIAASFDRELIAALGDHLGEEARAEKLHTLLGPAINIKRSPLCGRNFEYLSEDPYLTGELSASYVNHVQAKNVGVSVKHYAANNQEYRRMSSNSVVSERALREIYLAAFEKTIKESQPWTLMCAYNRLNGTYCCENEWLLETLPRGEWGYEGIVMTDWGAMNNRVEAIKAGLELEMPSSGGITDKKIVDAVKSGALSMDILDRAVERLLTWIDRGLDDKEVNAYDKEAHHNFARKAAAECAVLLKNENNVLPLNKGVKAAFIGTYANAPRFQGGGSSHINAFKTTSAVQAAENMADISYCQGWKDDGITADEILLAEAVKAAKAAEVAVVFAGLPDSFESEGYDRAHLNIPDCQNALIEAVAAVQPNTIVVLHTGSPILMPWLTKVPAVLNMYLGGQAVGGAAADVLFGDVCPSGRLAETFPIKLEDTPAYMNYPGNGDTVMYAEDVYVGYRWYDSRKMEVLFPFGFGLSYTSFAFSNLKLGAAEIAANDILSVSVDVTNTGERTGKQVVQLYVAPPVNAKQPRPVHELKGFEKVELAAGETTTVSFKLDSRSFAYFEERIGDWYIEAGEYSIQVGASCRDLPLCASIKVNNAPLPLKWSDTITIGDFMDAGRMDIIAPLIEGMKKTFSSAAESGDGAISNEMVQAMMGGMPLHSLASFGKLPEGFLDGIKSQLT